ncbi:hypothetical protein [Vagococcus xieshaowenii]|uniref:Uncharacterized protein n=1 Tax=Vagococcus xieshaowenii TaxID=2562451 RepID=A0AAJ5EFR9_9ENTE|nr:hypothetical protein [Vagococcus xieshaowenii]QCA28958.1 hypothetical protein E4Z98_06370 [Vagococcus xieshaowenii]TFZ43138.1 hypothetical protein E4031_00795 [Vagococcus xieshaowenii]
MMEKFFSVQSMISEIDLMDEVTFDNTYQNLFDLSDSLKMERKKNKEIRILKTEINNLKESLENEKKERSISEQEIILNNKNQSFKILDILDNIARLEFELDKKDIKSENSLKNATSKSSKKVSSDDNLLLNDGLKEKSNQKLDDENVKENLKNLDQDLQLFSEQLFYEIDNLFENN